MIKTCGFISVPIMEKKKLTDIESLKVSWNNLINIVMCFGKINIKAEGKYSRC